MDRFIVVVEVDHVRALAAYTKAVKEIELLWPQLLAGAHALDEPRRQAQAEREAKHKAYELELAEWYRAQAEREKAFAALDAWRAQPLFKRSSLPAPVIPELTTPPRMPTNYISATWMLPCATDRLASELAALRRKRDIASVATAAYRVMESDAIEMVAWERGEALERLKRVYLQEHTA